MLVPQSLTLGRYCPVRSENTPPSLRSQHLRPQAATSSGISTDLNPAMDVSCQRDRAQAVQNVLASVAPAEHTQRQPAHQSSSLRHTSSGSVLTAAAVAKASTSAAQAFVAASGPRVAYQGMAGAYSEIAARQACPDGEPLPCEHFETAFQLLSQWMADKAVLPIENILGGSNHGIYDLLMRYRLHIVGETWLNVQHCLAAPPGVRLKDVRRVMSHPHALAQCDNHLQRMPHVAKQAVTDTALAAKLVAQQGPGNMAAICSTTAAAQYGLEILEQGIQDSQPNLTRFIVLSRDALAPTHADMRPHKTSIVFSLPDDEESGQLFKALSVFALRDIDLATIQSRPLRASPLSMRLKSGARGFRYLFYVDMLINLSEERAQNALRHLQEFAPIMRVLGSFPREVVPDSLSAPSLDAAAALEQLALSSSQLGQAPDDDLAQGGIPEPPASPVAAEPGSNGASQPRQPDAAQQKTDEASNGSSSVPPEAAAAEAPSMKVGYQGCPGAYSEMAVRAACPDGEPTPCEQFEVAFQALEQGLVDRAVLPIENSLGGSIHPVYDLLIRYRVHIIGEVTREISHCLLALPGVQRTQVRRVISHWQALAQVDGYLRGMPGVVREAVDDTAGAAQIIAVQQLRDTAAVASSRAGELYGLQVLDEGIQDNKDNVTRFLVLSRDPCTSVPGDARPFKTSIVFAMPERAGQLFKALSVFALRNIDMTKIESRPMSSNPLGPDPSVASVAGKRLNNLFHIDFVANLAEQRAQNALRQLQEIAPYLRVLGCYPMYTGLKMTAESSEA